MRQQFGPQPRRAVRRSAPTVIGGCLLALLSLLSFVVSPAGADEISDKRAEAQRIAQKLAELRQQQMQLEGDFNEANLKLSSANDDIAAAQVRVDAVGKEYEQRKGEARLYAVAGYVHGNDDPSMNAILTTDGDKAPQKKGYLEAASGNRQDTVDHLKAARQKLDEEIASLDHAKGEAQAATDKASEAKRANDGAVAEQAKINAQVQGELGDLVRQEQARQAEETRKANEARLAELQNAEAAKPQPTSTTQAPAPSGTAAGTAAATPGSTGNAPKPAATAAPAPARSNNPAPAPAPVAAPKPAPAPAPAPTPAPVPSSGKGAAAASIAMGQMGVPYVYGGASPRGFDCSGLVMWAFAQVGVSLPHATSAQWAATAPISMSDLQVGDLIFFYGMGHVGIYIGGGRVVHAPHTGDVVRTEAVANMPVTGARRVR